jgi:hypothetical protein
VVVVCYLENKRVGLLSSKRRAFKKLPNECPASTQWGKLGKPCFRATILGLTSRCWRLKMMASYDTTDER